MPQPRQIEPIDTVLTAIAGTEVFFKSLCSPWRAGVSGPFAIWAILRQPLLWLSKPSTLLVIIAAFELDNMFNLNWNSLNPGLNLLLRHISPALSPRSSSLHPTL
ncbi:hypothetical protein BM1_10870 [Bipolaris maydis]|nr:hypothetical protein BM1_10870 [Bipolaris maydis]